MGEDRYAPPWLKLSRAQVIKIAALTVLVTAAVAALAAYLVTGKSQVRLHLAKAAIGRPVRLSCLRLLSGKICGLIVLVTAALAAYLVLARAR